jgi:CRISPR-associated protein Cas1
LLANAYLDPLDREFERAGVAFARYADDFFVACRTKTDAEAALALMTEFLGSVLHLALKPAKTQYCAIAEGVDFLGFKLDSRDLCVRQEKINRVEAAVAGDLQALADPQVRFSAKVAALHHMNALIRGFRNYFLVDDAPRILGQLRALDTTIEERARALLPVATRLELAWLARERFAPQARGEDEEARRDSSVVIGNYPDDGSIGIPDPTLAEFGGRTDALPASVTVSTAAGTVEPGLSQDADSSRDSDGVAVDGRLYVLTPGVFVTLREGQVELRRRHAILQRVPLDSLAMLILQGRGVGISVDLTVKLGERRVPVVFAPPFGRPAAIAASFEGGHSRLRRQQILRRSDPDMLRTGTAMLAAKVGNQASVLKYFARYRKKQDATALHAELSRSAGEVRPLADLIRDLDIASPTLRNMAMGYEGRAASRYWAAIAKLIPTDLAFPGRRTRGATDPFNQAINYVYGLLYGEVWKAVVHVGLDPYAGIMHGTERDQGSLIFDLIEEFRAPFGDRLVLGMLGRGFRPQLGRHGDLRASVRRLIVNAFHRMWSRPVRWRAKMHAPLQILEQQARDLARAFLAEGAYRPFQFRW